MKTCGMCKEEKPLTEFNIKNRERGWYQSVCKECQKVHRNRHYAKNKEAYIQRSLAFRKENRRLLNEWLSTKSCVDCGETDPVVFEFDHVRGKKVANITTMVNSYSWKSILKEIAKCDVRCANCHRRRTAKQLGWHSWVPVETET